MPLLMRRATFVAASTLATLAPALVRAQTLTTVQVVSSPNDDLIPVLLGVDSGAFRKAGLDVQVQKANNGTAVVAAVAGGAVDIGKSSAPAILVAHSKGLPFVLVAPAGIYTAESPTAGTIVAVNSPIKTGKDCEGKIMGVGALNDLTALAIKAWVDRNGGDSKTLRFVEIPPSAMGAAIADGRVDTGTLPDPALGVAIAGGQARLLAYTVSAIAPRFVQAAFFATADYVAKNKATVAAFRRVVEQSAAYANDHHDEMIPILSKFTGIDPKVIAAEPKQLFGTSLDVKLLQPLVDACAKYGAIPATFDARAMIDPGAG